MMQSRITLPIALTLLLLSYSAFLWNMSVPLTGDQKVYLTIALEMRERGEWLIPFLFEKANFLKPPLQYWATITGWSIFGFNLFGALIPSVLALVGSAWLVTRIAASPSGLCALFFGSTLASMTYGTTAQMEIWIVLFYLLAWFLALRGRIGSALGVAGVLAWVKGPLYSVLWVSGWVLHEVLHGRSKEIFKWKFIGKLSLGIAVGLSWFLIAATKFPAEIFGVFFRRENLEKISTPQGTMIGLWAEFIGTLFPLLPWFAMSFLDRDFRKRIRDRVPFLISFGLIPALFFTVFPYRVGTYLYILTPLAVWLMSESTINVRGPWIRGLQGVTLLTGVMLAFFVIRLSLGGWVSGILAGYALVSIFLWSAAHLRLVPAAIAVSSLLLVQAVRLGAVELGTRDLQALRAAAGGSPVRLAFLMESEDIWHEVGLVSSSIGERISVLRDRGDLTPFLESGGRVILNDSQLDLGADLSCTKWVRLKRRVKFPLRELIFAGLDATHPDLLRTYLVCGRGRT